MGRYYHKRPGKMPLIDLEDVMKAMAKIGRPARVYEIAVVLALPPYLKHYLGIVMHKLKKKGLVGSEVWRVGKSVRRAAWFIA